MGLSCVFDRVTIRGFTNVAGCIEKRNANRTETSDNQREVFDNMMKKGVRFSIARHSQWAPGLESDEQWQKWGEEPFLIDPSSDSTPAVVAMPAMLRRRARFLGRMALEVAYDCLGDLRDVPTIFCSRHGEVDQSVELIQKLIAEGDVSPIGFSSAVHNATAGLFSIARKEHSNHIALAAGANSVEHAAIEACGLLNDGAQAVLLVNYEQPLPEMFQHFQDCVEQPYAWAWLLVPATDDYIELKWQASDTGDASGYQGVAPMSVAAGLELLRFYIAKLPSIDRNVNGLQWNWSRHHASK